MIQVSDRNAVRKILTDIPSVQKKSPATIFSAKFIHPQCLSRYLQIHLVFCKVFVY